MLNTGLSKPIKIIQSDLFKNINDKFDIIVSNPPYIKEDEDIESIVKENEPDKALYGGIDGLEFYEQILKDINKNIKDKYLIAFEIGADQKSDLEELTNKYLPNSNYKCYKDLQERDRIFFISSKDVNI